MILLINDDGIDHPGMRALYAALRAHTGEPVLAVLPSAQRSGMSHAITLDRGLSITPRLEDGFFAFAVDGTPTDCTKVGLTVLAAEPPKLVVSGINDGPNCGRSILYSGTVGAAMEAAVEGHAALAVSRDLGGQQWTDAAEYAARIAAVLLGRDEYRGHVVNLNLPATAAAAWHPPRVCPHGRAGFTERYRPRRDAKDRITWHLHGEWTALAGQGDSDAHLLAAGHPTLSVLAPDLNANQRWLEKHLAGATATRKPRAQQAPAESER